LRRLGQVGGGSFDDTLKNCEVVDGSHNRILADSPQ
jgi:hypothetical protein